ncbi:MAG: sensor histidine kinase, partial [Microcoleaceae cyanobacterium]
EMLPIAQKIGYGYALVLGMITLGTVAGLSIGEYYQYQTKKYLNQIVTQRELFERIQDKTLHIGLHILNLPIVVDNSQAFDRESNELLSDINEVEKTILQVQKNLPKLSVAESDQEREYELLLNQSLKIIRYHRLMLPNLLKLVNELRQDPNQFDSIRLEILRQNTDVAQEIMKMNDRLEELVDLFDAQEADFLANNPNADLIRLKIILGSMCLSALFGIVLASLTSRAIAQPIEKVTEITQKVAASQNFDLRVPITTQDEIGSLGQSINYLIADIANYTAELQSTQSQLIHTEKMSTLGQMVAGVTHEINNPINFIHANIHYAESYLQSLLELVELYQAEYSTPSDLIETHMAEIDLDFLAEDLPKVISSIKVGADRIREIVVSMRNFSRLDESQTEYADINQGIDSTLIILSYRLKLGINVMKEYGEIPLIECYPSQLNQVFMNIIANALDALEEQISLCSSSDSEDHQGNKTNKTNKPTIKITTEKTTDDHIMIHIQDNGPGIPAKVQEQIFEAFFTTKTTGKGTGLGLAICGQILEKHQGKIQVNSQLGEGTEFIITLPVKLS